ncbi:hypothetical protein CK203_079931 [Vitis vinifera]|uniref:DUF4283 domain-containing protein n=1 Tax=Vitis vinifera TaxID=29760 RepID=A0A438E541_VITVI|nr:hypothetical protein CK203_079931 [Vitis vinifera]
MLIRITSGDGKRGESCWFALDSKSFEISMDVLGKKLKRIIVERNRGFTSWIRFGSSNLCWLLEGVEASCKGEFAQRFVKSWEDEGEERKFLCRSGEYKRSLKIEKARGSSVATTGRRRCVKRKGAVGRVPGWEMGRDFGLVMGQERNRRLGKKKRGLHEPAVWWSRCSQLGNLQRGKGRHVQKKAKYGGGNNSKFGPATKANGTLGWDMETAVERRPNEKGCMATKKNVGRLTLAHLQRCRRQISRVGPMRRGLFGFTEDCGPSHLGPLPNTHALNNCMKVGKPTLDSPKGPVVVGRPTFKDSSRARAHEGCREVVCGCPDGVYFGFQHGSSSPTPNTKELIDEALMEEVSRMGCLSPQMRVAVGAVGYK